jgi:hypothetical protein
VRGLFREVVLRYPQHPTENIRLSQNNIVDPENRYQQIFKIQVELPADISARTARASCVRSTVAR